MHANPGLRFDDRAWTPAEGLKAALALTRSQSERAELERFADLAMAGRLVRVAASSGEVEYQVRKPASRIRGITDPEKRRVVVVMTDATLDSYGDRMHPEGAKFDRYADNPMMLLDHDYTVAAIAGHALRWWIEEGQLLVEDEFDRAGTNAAADMAWPKIVNKSLRTVSIGFSPIRWAKILDDKNEWTGGFDFFEWLLYEHSWIPVPANPSAHMGLHPSGTTAEQALLHEAREIVMGINNRLLAAGLSARLKEFPS